MYASKNGGQYNFIVEPQQAMPQDQVRNYQILNLTQLFFFAFVFYNLWCNFGFSQQFWTNLFNQMKRWEFSTYMQVFDRSHLILTDQTRKGLWHSDQQSSHPSELNPLEL